MYAIRSYYARLFSGDSAQRVADLLKAPKKKSEISTVDSPLVLGDYQVKVKTLGDREEDTRVVILSDVTEHERSRQIVRLRNREQRLYTQAVQAFNSSLEFDQVT